jgi:hypothetical protein
VLDQPLATRFAFSPFLGPLGPETDLSKLPVAASMLPENAGFALHGANRKILGLSSCGGSMKTQKVFVSAISRRFPVIIPTGR